MEGLAVLERCVWDENELRFAYFVGLRDRLGQNNEGRGDNRFDEGVHICRSIKSSGLALESFGQFNFATDDRILQANVAERK